MGKEEVVFIDANIFLEFFLGNENADACERFLKRLANYELLAKTSDFIIYTCLLQIQQKLKSLQKMKEFISFINELGIEIIRPSLREIYNSTEIIEKYKLDFDDSLIVSIMSNNSIYKLVSLDKHFDKISSIKREKPEG